MPSRLSNWVKNSCISAWHETLLCSWKSVCGPHWLELYLKMVQPSSVNTQHSLQHNTRLAIKLALLIFTTIPHYKVSLDHCVYCAYYEGKEPSSSGNVPSANGIFRKTKHGTPKAAAQNSSNDCFNYLTTHGNRKSAQMDFKGVSMIQPQGE